MKHLYHVSILPLITGLAFIGLTPRASHASLFSSTKQTMNISCYDGLKIDAQVEAGGSLVIATGSCNVQSVQGIGKTGDIKTNFANLPSPIYLGKIGTNDIRTLNDIQTPQQGQKIIFTFVPSAGQLSGKTIEFMIERIAQSALSRELKTRNLGQMAQLLQTDNPHNETIELFVYYRALPGVTVGWLDLGETLTVSSNILPTFNIAIDDTGKLFINSPGSNNLTLMNPAVLNPRKGATNIQTAKESFENLINYYQIQKGIHNEEK